MPEYTIKYAPDESGKECEELAISIMTSMKRMQEIMDAYPLMICPDYFVDFLEKAHDFGRNRSQI